MIKVTYILDAARFFGNAINCLFFKQTYEVVVYLFAVKFIPFFNREVAFAT